MNSGRLSTARIAAGNILHRRLRSVCIVLLIAFTTLLVAGGTLLGLGLKNGVESINARLGADAMVVPQSAGGDFEGALLGGSPSTFYLNSTIASRVMSLDGVERATPQLFISSFASGHCAALLQIIGYDPKTDFVVTPWLGDSSVAEPRYGEVVIGNNVTLGIGDKLLLFSVTLDVAGILEKTGMGFDNSVFVNMETAQALLAEYGKYSEALPLPEGAGADDVVSVVLLDLENGADVLAFQRRVNSGFRGEGVRYVSSQALISDASKNLGLVIGILAVLLAAVWIFAVFVLAVIFTLALNERRREFGILRAIGATRRKLSAIVVTEATLLCGAGAVCGVGALCLIVFPYKALIGHVLQAAYLPPESGAVVGLLAACLVLGTAVGPLASLFAVARIGKNEALANMQDGV
jgi:putative ABC transport system permease protein